MQYRIEKSEFGDYGVAVILGEMTQDDLLPFWSEVGSFNREHKLNNFFVDLRDAVLRISVFQQYQMSYHHMKRVANPVFVRYAALVREDDHSFDFVETLEANNGRIFKICRNMEQVSIALGQPLESLA